MIASLSWSVAHLAEGDQHDATNMRKCSHDGAAAYLIKQEGSKLAVAWEGYNKPVTRCRLIPSIWE